MNLDEYENLHPHANFDGMLFSTPNSHCRWRIETLYSKEPDTIEWIKSMPEGAKLFDVGANIGVYSIFAAKRGIEVYAFEPESQNYAVLCKNIVLNKLQNCLAFPVALGAEHSIDTLRLSSLLAGGSCHSFGQDKDYRGNDKKFPVTQGCIGIPLYKFAHRFGAPDYIKIDVDGFEGQVLEGASDILPEVKSLLVEMDVNSESHMAWKKTLEGQGFKTDEAQIMAARRAEGPFVGIGNIIFTR